MICCFISVYRTSITTGEANTLTKSVRFLNISYSSSSSEGPSPEPHSKHDSELHSRLHSVPNNGLLHSKHDSEPHSLLDNGPHSLLDNDAALHHNELQSSNNNPIEHKHSDIDESLGDHSSSKHVSSANTTKNNNNCSSEILSMFEET